MNKLAIIPIFFLTMCGTAPITDDPAHACIPPLDGSEFECPTTWPPEVKLPKEEIRGEIDVYDPNHWQQMQYFWLRNARREQIEKNATTPTDAINNALLEFNHGSNDPPKSQELLQLQSDGDQEGT